MLPIWNMTLYMEYDTLFRNYGTLFRNYIEA
jgi:hypothetical protein